jgi:hypothetical protein
MSTLKQLLEERRQQYTQREILQKELSSLFNQQDIFDIIKESLSEELTVTNSSLQDKPCLRLRFKQYDDNPKSNHYMLEFYQQLNHLYPSFVIRLELNESKEELNVHVTEYANYEIKLSKNEIIQHIKDLIGV